MSTGLYSIIIYARKIGLVRYIIEGTAEMSSLITILGTIDLFLIAYLVLHHIYKNYELGTLFLMP